MSERITDDLALDALGLALARRRPPRACCIIRIAGVSTQAATTSECWRSTESSAA